jgi:26S proteasome non-ATPase regulatory subunit 10
MDPLTEDAYPLHTAIRTGSLTTAESLLSTNPSLAHSLDADSRLPLHISVSHNHLPITQLLADQPHFDPDAPDSLGWTALMMSSSRDDATPTVSFLLARGADPNAITANGQTALHFAASKSHLAVARMLVAKGASARKRDRRGQLALHRAAAVGSVPVMRLLLEERSPVDARDVDGLTALHHALAEGRGDAAVVLLRAGADSAVRDRVGELPIDCADAKVCCCCLSLLLSFRCLCVWLTCSTIY